MPESPRHLMATDREDEAIKVLKRLHYDGHNRMASIKSATFLILIYWQRNGLTASSTKLSRLLQPRKPSLFLAGESCLRYHNGEQD
jgi:hypothetical protein